MKLIVGLGNPDKEYENTRHNIGFMAIDSILKKYNVSNFKEKHNGIYYELSFNNEKVILLKPQKYMNLSGEVIKKYVDFYKIDVKDILVISDDLDLPLGTYRLREKGSSGGHNGLKNIELHLHTNEYKRIKIGISNNKNIDTKDYVLGRLSNVEKEEIRKVLDIIPSIFEDYMKIDFVKLMNKYNHK